MGQRDKLAAAAALQPMSHCRWMSWLLLAVVVQLSWGLYGVCTRYLQTRAAQPVPTLQLIVAINVLAWPGLLLFCSLPNWIRKQLARRHCHNSSHNDTDVQQQVVAEAFAPQRSSCEEKDVESAGQADLEQGLSNAQSNRVSNGGGSSNDNSCNQNVGRKLDHDIVHEIPGSKEPPAWRRRLYTEAVAFGIGSLVVLQALSQIYASYFTNAYLAQLIFMLCPLFTAVANKVLLRQPAPAQLWPTLILALAGSGMVIAGNWISNGNSSSTLGSKNLTPQVSLIVGVSFALLSTLLLSAYLVLLQVTRHIVTGEQVLWAKRNMAAVVLVPLALAVEGTNWGWVRALTVSDWLVLVFTGIFIYTLANIWLQFCSRNLGAATVSVFISLRLVASVVGSSLLLMEVPRHPLTWSGFAVVVLVMTAFLLLQYKKKQHDVQDGRNNSPNKGTSKLSSSASNRSYLPTAAAGAVTSPLPAAAAAADSASGSAEGAAGSSSSTSNGSLSSSGLTPVASSSSSVNIILASAGAAGACGPEAAADTLHAADFVVAAAAPASTHSCGDDWSSAGSCDKLLKATAGKSSDSASDNV